MVMLTPGQCFATCRTPAFGVRCRQAHARAVQQRESADTGSSERVTVEHLENHLRLGSDRNISEVDAQRLAASFGTSLQSGLPEKLVGRQLELYGRNEVPDAEPAKFWELVRDALDDFTVLVLLASGATSLVLWYFAEQAQGSGWIDGVAILAAVLVVVLVSAVTNYQRDKQFQQLSAEEKNIRVRVRREGKEQSIHVSSLAVGDVLLFNAGDILAADGALVQGWDVRVDESHLTGESEDVEKRTSADARVYSGSQVVSGWGEMLVLAVGEQSQAGRILMMTRAGAEGNAAPAARPPGAASAQGERGPEELETGAVLMKKLDRLAADIGKFGIAAAALDFALLIGYEVWGVVAGGGPGLNLTLLQHLNDAALDAITVLVVAVPEGLPLAVTMALAFSVRRMLADNNLVRYLSACETMATCTTICSDKTGTLTTNRLRVQRAWIAGCFLDSSLSHRSVDILSPDEASVPDRLRPLSAPTLATVVSAICVNSTASLDRDESGRVVDNGNRTETALLRFACALGADVTAERAAVKTVAALPFSSERKSMSVLVEGAAPVQLCGGGQEASGGAPGDARTRNGAQSACYTLYCKGAAEAVLQKCKFKLGPDGTAAPVSEQEKEEHVARVQASGLRVLAVAARVLTGAQVPRAAVDGSDPRAAADALEALGHDLTLVAVFGIADQLRAAVPASVTRCQDAGITVRMLTGDGLQTARAVARECGILNGDADVDGVVMTGEAFRQRVQSASGDVDQAAFDRLWPDLRVLARCSPTDKFLIVRGCQGHRLRDGRRDIVAMTGDGTNDAPALRNADVGFAMISGTSIARQASDILLMDDNFTSIVQSVKWGRNVYTSILKFLQFQLTINVVAVVTAIAGSILLPGGSPLTPVQMLWVNMIMDSLASLSLATEPPTDNLLLLKPFSSETPLLTPTIVKHVVGQAVYQLAVIGTILWDNGATLGLTHAETLTFTFNTFVVIQLFNQVACRKAFDEANIMTGLLDNRIFLGVLGAEALLQVLIVNIGGDAFGTVPLTWQLWAVSAGFGLGGWLVRGALLAIPTRRFDDALPEQAAD